MTARASQVRGYLKTTARPLVEAAYGINPNAPKREIRNLVEDLQSRNNFMYKVRQFLSVLFLLSFFVFRT